MKTLIISKKTGRLGNRLILFSHFIGVAKENNIRLWNFAFFEYAHLFENIGNSIFCDFNKTNNKTLEPKFRLVAYFLNRFFYKILKTVSFFPFFGIIIVKSYAKNQIKIVDLIKEILRTNTKVIITQGYFFRAPNEVQKHSEFIRNYFKPKNYIIKPVDKLFENLRATNEIIIGVHIRQTDYQTYLNGKFYYTIDDYYNWIFQLNSELNNIKKCFLISSDTKLDNNYFKDFNINIFSGEPLQAMYALSSCDYIFGPPSSFSAWSAFYGEKPLCVLNSKNIPLKIADFIVLKYPDNPECL